MVLVPAGLSRLSRGDLRHHPISAVPELGYGGFLCNRHALC
jgi:hypothetical protein